MKHPQWRAHPAAVVAEDKPLAPILWVNDIAHRFRILPGMRYAAGLSLSRDLHADVIEPAEVAQAVRQLLEIFELYSDQVEAAQTDASIFWLNIDGFEKLYPNLEAWGDQLRADLQTRAFESVIVAGYTRFGSYALARGHRAPKTWVFQSARDERRQLQKVPLDRLGIAPKFREDLKKLGIVRLGQLLKLPAQSIMERFGPEAHALVQDAAQEGWTPLHVTPIERAFEVQQNLEDVETDVHRLLFLIKRELSLALRKLSQDHHLLKALILRLELDGAPDLSECVRLAAPTLDEAQILELIRLRLEALQQHKNMLGRGIIAWGLKLDTLRATTDQLCLFSERPRRDFSAAARAFARLRAEFGANAVVEAQLCAAHLPEAQLTWSPSMQLRPASPADVALPSNVRRWFTPVQQLASKPRQMRDNGWLILGPEAGAVAELGRPYIISGGWWSKLVHRAYHLARTQRGDRLWTYYDRARRRWFLQGIWQ